MEISHNFIGNQSSQVADKTILNHQISIDELLQIQSIFQGVFVPEGHTKPIERISVIELKDFSSWIKGKELVLTTLESFHTKELQLLLLKKLIEGGVTCLGFHPGNEAQHDFEIFPETISYAKKCNFPILRLNSTSTYSEIIELIFDFEMKKYNSKVSVLSNVNQLLFHYLSQNLSQGKLLDNIGKLTDLQLIILDVNMSPIADSRINRTYKEIVTSSTFKRYMNNEKVIKQLINGSNINIKVSLETEKVNMLAQPIKDSKYVNQVLIVIGNLNRPIIDRIIKTTVSALNIKKEHSLENRFRMMEKANALLFEKNDIQAAESQFANVNRTLKDKTGIVLIDIDAKLKYQNKKELDYLDNLKFRITKRIDSYLKDGSFSSWYQNWIVIFLEKNSTINKNIIAEELLKDMTGTYPALDIQLGLSSTQTDSLYRAYKEAMLAMKHGLENDVNIQLFDAIGFQKVFTDFDNKYYIEQFCYTTLKPLYVLEKEKQVELMKTLEAFLNQNLSYKDTANHLYVHPNTIRYRIQSIKELFKDEEIFTDPEKRFNLSFAIKLSSIL